jgi:hypothetical protein
MSIHGARTEYPVAANPPTFPGWPLPGRSINCSTAGSRFRRQGIAYRNDPMAVMQIINPLGIGTTESYSASWLWKVRA